MTCERCGAFAVLQSNGFRELCASCWTRAHHRIEERRTSLVELVSGLWALMAEFWKPTLLLTAIGELPLVAVRWTREIPLWVSMPYQIVVGSFFEALVISIVTQQALAGRPSLDLAMRRAKSRYLAVVGVNTLVGLLALVCTALLCLPAVAVTALMWCAVPLAILEGATPLGACKESYRRSRAAFWPFVLVALVTMILSMLPFLVEAVVMGFARVRGVTVPDETLAASRVAGRALVTPTHMVSILFQFVAWGATRPVPPVVPPGQSIAARV